MHQISFRFVPDFEDSKSALVAITIDGQDLLDLVRAYETPYAVREGHQSLAGGYKYLAAQFAHPSCRHFLGEPQELGTYGGNKVAVLECECGTPGCWPLLCEISLVGGTIVWKNFEQPYRRAESPGGFWDYARFGPFCFSQGEYEQALAAIAAT